MRGSAQAEACGSGRRVAVDYSWARHNPRERRRRLKSHGSALTAGPCRPTCEKRPMNIRSARANCVEFVTRCAILLLFAVVSIAGITWGLPSRKIDKYLFGDDPPWPGEKVYRLAGAADKFTPDRGADVDVDPLDESGSEAVLLTRTEEDVAKIYLRYRLYTYQPDEMITMMALAGMNPRRLELDPRLYQYGGLFIYPVGALIGACGLVGLIDVRSDIVYYLDNPDEFGKFYMVARAYSAAWGLVGVLIVFAIARRLSGLRAGLLAGLLFTLMPVVICMAHEGKPHLPGAVLMLMAVLFAMRYLDNVTSRDWWLMCTCCGAAFGMVLSSWPIFVLIPLIAWLEARGARGGILRGVTNAQQPPLTPASPRGLPIDRDSIPPAARSGNADTYGVAVKRTIGGVVIGVLVYSITNPYILINAFANREVLSSNFGNSLAMYEVARIGEGFVRVLQLTVEGATLPIVALGAISLFVACIRMGGTGKRSLHVGGGHTNRGEPVDGGHAGASLGHGTRYDTRKKNALIIPLAVPAAVLFLQFVLIGAGKPPEYGRFGVFTNTALAIGTACLLARRWTRLREIVNWIPAAFIALWVAYFGLAYLWNFHVDATDVGSRSRLAGLGGSRLDDPASGRCAMGLAVLAVPAPYSLPPTDFSRTDVLLFRSNDHFLTTAGSLGAVLIEPVDQRGYMRRGLAGDASRPEHDPSLLTLPRERRFRGRLELPWHRTTSISWANKPFQVDGQRAPEVDLQECLAQ